MSIPYQLFIALRYLKSKKRHKGISLNTVISICGIAIGVMTLVVVISVMSGMQEILRTKILSANSHAVILNHISGIEDHELIITKLKNEPYIVSIAPFVMSQVMISSGERSHGVFIRGIDPFYKHGSTDILNHLKKGDIKKSTLKDDTPWIILGSELAAILGVIPEDIVNVISPFGEIGPLGMLPKVRQLRVAAIFEIGMFEFDANLALAGLKFTQNFFGYGNSITGIELKFDDIHKAPIIHEYVSEKLGFPYYARDWIQMNRSLFAALELERFAMFIILTLIVLVASFNIVSILLMNVIEKQKEIAILKAMGAANHGIMTVFMLQGLMIGIVGTLIGLAGGYTLGSILYNYEIIKLPADVYHLSTLPVKMKLTDFIIIATAAISISFLSTLYPSYRAAKLDPVESLRYE